MNTGSPLPTFRVNRVDLHDAPRFRWAMLALVLLASAGNARLAEARPLDPLVFDSHPMQATAGSDLVFDELRVDALSGGGRQVAATWTQSARVVHEAFFFFVDPASGTYRTVRLPQSEEGIASVVRGELKRYAVSGDRAVVARTIARHVFQLLGRPAPSEEEAVASSDDWEAPPICDEQDECDSECSGNWTAKVTTYDPVYVELTSTSAFGWWDRYTLRWCVWKSGGVNSCWAANPSPLNTHWYIQSCSASGPYGDELSFNYTANGSYINWDFLLDSQATTVSQSVNIRLTRGIGVGTSWYHVDAGEASALIFGSFTQSGRNTCF